MIKKITIGCALFSLALSAGAQDWPNLKRYQSANEQVQTPAATEKRAVYMGDSITDFWIKYDSVFFAGKPYFDRGISGQTTGQMLLRFRQDVLNLKPKVVVILGGINDIAENNGPTTIEEIFGNLVSMAELAKANHIQVVLASVLPANILPWKPAIDPVPKVKALNELIKNYTKQNNLVYLDYFSAMRDEKNGLLTSLAKDAVHPNLEGYKVMEPLAEKAIAEALKKK